MEVFIMGQDPWQSLQVAIAYDHELMKHTSVTLIFAFGGLVHSRTVALSNPPTRVWGISLPGCPRKGCSAKPHDVRSEVHRKSTVFHEKARFSCISCGFRTTWIQRPPWIHEMGAIYPRRFWFDFPLHHSDLATFNASLLAHQVTGEESMEMDE
jgi:hypothetical protein